MVIVPLGIPCDALGHQNFEHHELVTLLLKMWPNQNPRWWSFKPSLVSHRVGARKLSVPGSKSLPLETSEAKTKISTETAYQIKTVLNRTNWTSRSKSGQHRPEQKNIHKKSKINIQINHVSSNKCSLDCDSSGLQWRRRTQGIQANTCYLGFRWGTKCRVNLTRPEHVVERTGLRFIHELILRWETCWFALRGNPAILCGTSYCFPAADEITPNSFLAELKQERGGRSLRSLLYLEFILWEKY